MDQAAIRNLTSQLADDLSWLEEHGRSPLDQTKNLGIQRLAAAMVRNVVGPHLEGQEGEPLHLAVVGGASAGKSTIANMLLGCVLAEANAQAGFTRHPIAYTSSKDMTAWAAHLGFLGPLHRLTTPASAHLDEDVYQVRKVEVAPDQFSLLNHFVIWDCPDMTTWAASNYVSRMLEVAGLADVVVYVASAQRYNDALATQFLKLFLEAGKAVVTVVTKMRPDDAPALLEDFQKEILAKAPAPVIASLAVPQLTHAQLADPVNLAAQYRVPLVNQISIFASSVKKTRQRTVASAMNYLKHHQTDLLGVAKGDLVVLEDWRVLVMKGQAEFVSRYRREFLDAERSPRFDEALVRFLDLLDIPGTDKISKFLRTPFALLKGLFFKATQRPDAPQVAEKPVLERALTGWTDALHKETSRHTATHPAWAYIDKGFSSGMMDQVHKQFETSLKTFHAGLNEEVDRTARAIYEDLEKHPVFLNTLRGVKLVIPVAAVGGCAIYLAAHIDWYWNLLVALLLFGVTNQLVEILCNVYVETRRVRARKRQEILLKGHLADPLAESFITWPISGGSALEHLSLVLRRIPDSIAKLDPLVRGE